MRSRIDPPPWLHEVAPLSDETSIADLQVLGQLPRELSGRYVRIGPSGSGGTAVCGLRDAPMVHAITITGGLALGYRNRWVLTDATARTLGTDTIPGPSDHVGHLTTIAVVDDALLATGPGPVAYQLSADLKTLRKRPRVDDDRRGEALERRARWRLAAGVAHRAAGGTRLDDRCTSTGWIGELVEVADDHEPRWLVGLCHRQDEPCVRLAIWEADRPGRPVAEVLIPRRLPPALDATWSPDAVTARRLRARRGLR